MAIIEPTLELESSAFEHGLRYLIGIDEVGRGAVAGPVAIGAALIALPVADFPKGLRDSKLMTALSRQRMSPQLVEWLKVSQVGYASPDEIDDLG
ncbi:MAG: ribonuclease HII, partial [Microbacteriaceae bacterium]